MCRMTRDELLERSRELGFAKVCLTEPRALDIPKEGLIGDPASVLPDVRTLIFLLMPYRIGLTKETGEGVISSYYPASHSAYLAAKRLAGEIKEAGFDAVSNVQLPLKPWLLGLGLGKMGRNSLVIVKGLGSAFHVQCILTNAPWEPTHYWSGRQKGLYEGCEHCMRCVSACPAGAIRESCMIDQEVCIRAVSEKDPVPEGFEKKLGARLLGCDVCQSACPANAALLNGSALSVSLKELLCGQLGTLPDVIGTNYARKRRLRKKAALLAANLHRTDLTQELENMAQSPDPGEAGAALRALKRLKEET